MTTNNKRKIWGIIGALLVLIIPYVVMRQNQNAHLEAAQSYCPFKMLTGLPCPGCGMTKSLVFLYEGNLTKSISYHLFGPFIFLLAVATIVVLTTELLTHKEYFNHLIYNKRVAYLLGTTLFVYHLSRLVYFVSTTSVDHILAQSIWK